MWVSLYGRKLHSYVMRSSTLPHTPSRIHTCTMHACMQACTQILAHMHIILTHLCLSLHHTVTCTPWPTVIGEPPRFMTPQYPNVYVYVNNSAGDPQNLVLPCPLVDTASVTFQWFRGLSLVPTEMVDPATGLLTVYNITEGEYASEAGVNYYCVATRMIGKDKYSASVRSRTITVFYACKCCVSKLFY